MHSISRCKQTQYWEPRGTSGAFFSNQGTPPTGSLFREKQKSERKLPGGGDVGRQATDLYGDTSMGAGLPI